MARMTTEFNDQLFSVLASSTGFTVFTKALSAKLYFKNGSLDLLSGEKKTENFSDFKAELEKRSFRSHDKHQVTHFFYEAGDNLAGDESKEAPLAIDIEFGQKRYEKKLFKKSRLGSLSLEKCPDFKAYSQAFERGYEALLRGDCYQFNLTYPFQFRLDGKRTPLDFLSNFWDNNQKRGAYANATWIPLLNKLYFSNSPECLFQVYQKKTSQLLFETLPIKGTYRGVGTLPPQFREAKEFFKKSLKDRGELNMITDLLRNDLSRIEKPTAIVKKAFNFLKVPGLYHQFSRIQVETSTQVNVLQVLKALFPGGSITGAPKRRVMSLLNDLEKVERGFYCGSTLVQSGKVQAASINIRSGFYMPDSGLVQLHAGGGITLKSQLADEYAEMWAKIHSVTQLIAPLTQSFEDVRPVSDSV